MPKTRCIISIISALTVFGGDARSGDILSMMGSNDFNFGALLLIMPVPDWKFLLLMLIDSEFWDIWDGLETLPFNS